MWTLFHHPSAPGSRKVRIALSELGVPCQIELVSYWLRQPEFTRLNVAAEVPVLMLEDEQVVVGDQAICEFLDEVKPDHTLLGPSLEQRSETRRLLQWFDHKFSREVTDCIIGEKLVKRLARTGSPHADTIRVGIANIHYHLDYIGWLVERRSWLAGNDFSLADCAAAAHISLVDYLGDVPWTDHDDARTWYMKVKSRPAFRPLLTETMAGIAPAEHYANLDF